MRVCQAARSIGVTDAALFYWVKKRPDLFEKDEKGWTITAENLAKLPVKARGKNAPAPARPPVPETKPAPKPQPVVLPSTVRSGERQVGWWCKRCEAPLPMLHKFCKCLDGMETKRVIAAHQARLWVPLFVRLSVTLGAP